jgi:hypothetical protein
VHQTAALSIKLEMQFWIMKTREYALGFVAERRANETKYGGGVLPEGHIGPAAFCTSSDGTCVAVVGRVIVWAEPFQDGSDGADALSVTIPMLSAAIAHARLAGA